MCAEPEATIKNRPTRGTEGSALVISMVLLLLLMVLGTSLLGLSRVESNISHNDQWSEGALLTAEAALHVALEQLSTNPVVSVQPLAQTSLSATYAYRSGGRLDAAPQPQLYLGNASESGYSIGLGTGYNASGYSFARYQINTTGIAPRNTRREIEALAQYGPVPE